MKHKLIDSYDWIGWHGDNFSINWCFDVGDHTVELRQIPDIDAERLRVKIYKRELAPLFYFWLGQHETGAQ